MFFSNKNSNNIFFLKNYIEIYDNIINLLILEILIQQNTTILWQFLKEREIQIKRSLNFNSLIYKDKNNHYKKAHKKILSIIY